jgi:hypothetical protein
MSARSPRNRSRRPIRTRLAVTELEPRQLLTVMLQPVPPDEEEPPAPEPPPPEVPSYSSNPGEDRVIYLDFDGNYRFFTEGGVPYYARTPVFSLNADETTFTAEELDYIEQIFLLAAEDFAPFKVNVTTSYAAYVNRGPGSVLVAIGGSADDWLGEDGSGKWFEAVSSTVWVFSHKPSGVAYTAKKMGDTVSHEAGHRYGLHHQGEYDGAVWDEYSENEQDGMPSTLHAPLMGESKAAARSTWWVGRVMSLERERLLEQQLQELSQGSAPIDINPMQDDLAGLADRLGYRADDHGDSFATAHALNSWTLQPTGPKQIAIPTLSPDTNMELVGTGLIERLTDADYFSFHIGVRSKVTVTVDVPADVANLDGRVELWNAQFSDQGPVYSYLIDDESPGSFGGEAVTATLAPGKYYVVIRSTGTMGDVGTYTVNVKVEEADAFVLHGTTLTVYGTSSADLLEITPGPSDPSLVSFVLWQRQSDGSLRQLEYLSYYVPSTVTAVTFFGYQGNDTLVNQTAVATVAYGHEGTDTFWGGTGIDQLLGGEGDDELHGGASNDVLRGGDGDDDLYGDAGRDQLFGEAGADYLDGGHDFVSDILTGGLGIDHFIQHFNPARGGGWVAEDVLTDLLYYPFDRMTPRYWS